MRHNKRRWRRPQDAHLVVWRRTACVLLCVASSALLVGRLEWSGRKRPQDDSQRNDWIAETRREGLRLLLVVDFPETERVMLSSRLRRGVIFANLKLGSQRHSLIVPERKYITSRVSAVYSLTPSRWIPITFNTQPLIARV